MMVSLQVQAAETSLLARLKTAAAEEAAALQTLIATEKAIAELRARVEAGGVVAEACPPPFPPLLVARAGD